MRAVGGPVVKDVVLVGAGHAHVAVLRNFGMRPLPGVRLTLVTREPEAPYSGMLPGVVAGHYTRDDAHIDTGALARFAGARLYHDEAVGLDLASRRVLCRGRPPVPYDLLSLNIGSRPNTGDVPGAAEHAIPVKPIDGFLDRFEALRARVLTGRSHRVLLVGGGAGGVELLLSVERRLRRDAAAAGIDPASLSFALVSGSAGILPGFPAAFRARFVAVLAARGIAVHAGARVTAVDAGGVAVADAQGPRTIAADEVLWTTEASPAAWLADTGLALDSRGFIEVDACLRATGREVVFAAGDTVAFGPRPIPRSGVYAVRAGPVVAANLRAALTGSRLRAYRPQRDVLYIVSTGEPYAVATRNGLTLAGDWVWSLKDRIDRRFIARFTELPDMTPKGGDEAASPLADAAALRELSSIAMRCGGCGAKVGATVLSRALGRIEPAPRADVLVGLDAPDDAAVVDAGGERLLVQTVDYFRAIVDDPYRFGMIAANHALGDVYAMGAEPQTALAIATVPYGLEAKVEADLSDMMQGANEVLRDAGCALVGGHTSEGAELSLGFAVNGLARRDGFLRKGGLQPGDALVLTKPIGTGTLLAADMRGLAKARWVRDAIDHMVVSNRRAAAVLAGHGVHAATDVTGFGLLGHLVEMTKASGVDVDLFVDCIPVLDGALESVARGVFSSLQPQNLRLRRAIRDLEAAQALPMFPMLFDPQTAGGLLASVPAGRAADCVAALRSAGYAHAAVIGAVLAQTDELAAVTLKERRSARATMPAERARVADGVAPAA